MYYGMLKATTESLTNAYGNIEK
jgi:hypothetical protein